MSSAEATAEDAVVVTAAVRRAVRRKDATRAAAVLAVIAITQLTWLAALVYGVVWLLT